MYTLHFYAATHKQELRDRAEAAWEKGIPILFQNVQEWSVLAMGH